MVGITSIWPYIHTALEWVRTMAAKIPIDSNLSLAAIAILIAFIIKRGRVLDTIAMIIMAALIFLLLRLG